MVSREKLQIIYGDIDRFLTETRKDGSQINIKTCLMREKNKNK